MTLFKNFDWSARSIAKALGLVLLAVIALSITISLVTFAVRTIFSVGQENYSVSQRGGYDIAEEAYFDGASMAPSMSRPGGIVMPEPGFSTGENAEDFEVKSYDGTINSRQLDQTCATIADLKGREDVIFESSNKNEESCSYRFKVKKENELEIVTVIQALNPEIFNANITSIKKAVEGVDTELDILQKKLSSIEETLTNAQESYDSISVIATRQQDAETLAKIIDSKLNLIEKLTTERLNIKSQIEYYNKSKSDQLDQLNFTFFNIHVYKDVILDWKQIKDNWKYEAKELVRTINDAIQGVTLNLITYLARFAQVVIYLFISIILLKLVWLGIKHIWKGDMGFKRHR